MNLEQEVPGNQGAGGRTRNYVALWVGIFTQRGGKNVESKVLAIKTLEAGFMLLFGSESSASVAERMSKLNSQSIS